MIFELKTDKQTYRLEFGKCRHGAYEYEIRFEAQSLDEAHRLLSTLKREIEDSPHIGVTVARTC